MPQEIIFDLILRGVFFFLLLMYTIYGVILGYHWFSYGERRAVALGTMGIYLAIGASCFALMAPALFL